MVLSVIIPVLDEAAGIQTMLQSLQTLRTRGHEIIVVDGGSRDNTVALAEQLADRVECGARGRARQMNTGARLARGEILWFLHGDSRVDASADLRIQQAVSAGAAWGRFDIRLSGDRWLLRIVETMMNWRSRFSGIATGDQGIFVSRVLFEQIGGFTEIPLMEDIDLSKRLKKYGDPACLRQPLVTSSRRWERDGILHTIALMWYLRLAYFLGVPAERLAAYYD